MLDLTLLVFIALASVTIGSRVVSKHLWLTLPIGLLAIVVLRVATYAVTAFLAQLQVSFENLDLWLFIASVVAVSIPGVKNLPKQGWAILVSVGFVALAEFGSRVLGLFTKPHGDSLWILALAEYVSGGGSASVMGTSMSLKRGFSLILMLGLGEGKTRIDEFMPIIFGMLAIVTIGFGLHVMRGFSRRVLVIATAAVAATVFTAAMPWIAVFYVNGHTLVALGLMVVVATMLFGNELFASRRAQLFTVCLGLSVVTLTRPEGALLSLVVIALFANRKGSKPTEVLVSIATVFASFLTWMYVVNSYLLTGRVAWLLPLGMVIFVAGVWALYRWVPKLINRLFALTPLILLTVFVGLQIVFFDALQKGDRSLFTNLFLGFGAWGFMLWGFLVINVLSFFLERQRIFGTLMRVLGTLVLTSFLAKMVDGGQFGAPTLGRVGWDDSLNRMWFHFIGLFIVTAVVGVAQVLTSKFVGFNFKPRSIDTVDLEATPAAGENK
jgi:hypothetical protein